MTEASHRTDESVADACNQPEFPQIITPAPIQLSTSSAYSAVISPPEHNDMLAISLHEKLATLQFSVSHGNMTKSIGS